MYLMFLSINKTCYKTTFKLSIARFVVIQNFVDRCPLLAMMFVCDQKVADLKRKKSYNIKRHDRNNTFITFNYIYTLEDIFFTNTEKIVLHHLDFFLSNIYNELWFKYVGI